MEYAVLWLSLSLGLTIFFIVWCLMLRGDVRSQAGVIKIQTESIQRTHDDMVKRFKFDVQRNKRSGKLYIKTNFNNTYVGTRLTQFDEIEDVLEFIESNYNIDPSLADVRYKDERQNVAV